VSGALAWTAGLADFHGREIGGADGKVVTNLRNGNAASFDEVMHTTDAQAKLDCGIADRNEIGFGHRETIHDLAVVGWT
jgi:hypothetical protein